MVDVRGCAFPDDLLYDVARHTWHRPIDAARVRFGITCVGVALAREVLVFTPKWVGYAFATGRSVATMESAKWVGSVRCAFDGTIVAINEALVRAPTVVNDDCYGAGWMMELQPASAAWREGLVTGPAIAAAYAAWMEEQAFPGCGER